MGSFYRAKDLFDESVRQQYSIPERAYGTSNTCQEMGRDEPAQNRRRSIVVDGHAQRVIYHGPIFAGGRFRSARKHLGSSIFRLLCVWLRDRWMLSDPV